MNGRAAWSLPARALLAQLVAFALALLAASLGVRLGEAGWLLYWAVTAGVAAYLLRLPSWWWLICAAFVPALWWARQWQLAAGWYALALLFCVLLFGAVFRSRVPLWLSGRRARQRLLELIPAHAQWRVVDLGAGFGGVLASWTRERPQLRCVGYEWAWLPYLLGRLRLRWAGYRGQWLAASFWTHSLADYELVFAYLSPAPMAELWAKAQAEMRPGSRLVSYRFAVPEVEPEQRLAVGTRADDCLWVYRPAG